MNDCKMDSVLSAHDDAYLLSLTAYFRSIFKVYIKADGETHNASNPIKNDAMLYCIQLRRLTVANSFVEKQKEYGIKEGWEYLIEYPAKQVAEILADRDFLEIQKQATAFAGQYDFKRMPLTLNELIYRLTDLADHDHRRIINYLTYAISHDIKPTMRGFKKFYTICDTWVNVAQGQHDEEDIKKNKERSIKRKMVQLGLKFNQNSGRPGRQTLPVY